MEEIKRYMLLEDNIVVAFYSTDIHTEIPKEAIEISEELWQQLLELGQGKLKTGKTENFTIDDFEQNIIEPTEQEKAQMEIVELETYLLNTDFVKTQWDEEADLGIEHNRKEEEYKNVLQERQKKREKIRELKKIAEGEN